MSDASKPFAFSQFVPGFDFLRSLAGGSAAGAGAVPGMPTLSSWVAPTLSVEEVDKRIQELKAVQYWLEQNGHALKATIQALEVQKMTLSTLRGMNLRMEDLANSFTRQATAPAAEPAPRASFRSEPAPAPAPEPAPAAAPEPPSEAAAPSGDGPARKPAGSEAGVVDPLQWWGALTQQFQQIAASALQEASNLKMPAAAARGAEPATPKRGAATAKPARKRPAAKKKKAPAKRATGAAAAPEAVARRPR